MRMTYEYIRVVYGYTYIYIHIYFSLFKVDKNYNSLITNKHQLKNFFEKKGKKKIHKHINCIYPTLAINLLHKLHGQSSQLHNCIFALKISSDEESFIAMGTFCHN